MSERLNPPGRTQSIVNRHRGGGDRLCRTEGVKSNISKRQISTLSSTLRTGIIELQTRRLGLPLLVRSGSFFLS